MMYHAVKLVCHCCCEEGVGVPPSRAGCYVSVFHVLRHQIERGTADTYQASSHSISTVFRL